MMFMISVNAKRFALYGAAALVLLSATIGGVYLVSKREALPASTQNGISLCADSDEERQAFFSQFDLTVDPESEEVREVVIPDPLDDVYETYNALQKQQGFDLTKYCGKRVKSRSYAVVGAADPSIDGSWRVNLRVYRGKVSAADLAQPALNGTMRPLIPG